MTCELARAKRGAPAASLSRRCAAAAATDCSSGSSRPSPFSVGSSISAMHRTLTWRRVTAGFPNPRSRSRSFDERGRYPDCVSMRVIAGPTVERVIELVEGAIAIDSTRDEAYVQHTSLVPHGTPFTSSDVERFGMTLASLVPAAS